MPLNLLATIEFLFHELQVSCAKLYLLLLIELRITVRSNAEHSMREM